MFVRKVDIAAAVAIAADPEGGWAGSRFRALMEDIG